MTKHTKQEEMYHSCCGAMGLVASLASWDTGSIPGQVQWVTDLALLQLQHRSQLWLDLIPGLEISYPVRWPKKERGERERKCELKGYFSNFEKSPSELSVDVSSI